MERAHQPEQINQLPDLTDEKKHSAQSSQHAGTENGAVAYAGCLLGTLLRGKGQKRLRVGRCAQQNRAHSGQCQWQRKGRHGADGVQTQQSADRCQNRGRQVQNRQGTSFEQAGHGLVPGHAYGGESPQEHSRQQQHVADDNAGAQYGQQSAYGITGLLAAGCQQ